LWNVCVFHFNEFLLVYFFLYSVHIVLKMDLWKYEVQQLALNYRSDKVWKLEVYLCHGNYWTFLKCFFEFYNYLIVNHLIDHIFVLTLIYIHPETDEVIG